MTAYDFESQDWRDKMDRFEKLALLHPSPNLDHMRIANFPSVKKEDLYQLRIVKE